MGEYKPAHITGGEGASCENEKKGAFAGAVFGDVLCYTLGVSPWAWYGLVYF